MPVVDLLDDDLGSFLRRHASPRFNPAERTCLGPGCLGRRTFHSAHAGERICPGCRQILRRRFGVDCPAEDWDR